MARQTRIKSAEVPALSTPGAVFDELIALTRKTSAPEDHPLIKSLGKSHPGLLVASAPILCAALRSATRADDEYDDFGQTRRQILQSALRSLLRLKLPFDRDNALPIFQYLLARPDLNTWEDPLLLTVGLAEQLAKDHPPLPPPVVDCLARIRQTLDTRHAQRNDRKAVERIDALLGQSPSLPLKPGDPIADAILADLSALPATGQAAWSDLLKHCSNSRGGTPSKSWLKSLGPLLDSVSPQFSNCLVRWSPLLSASRADGKPARIDPSNYETLKGLTWCAGVLARTYGERGYHDPQLAASFQQLAIAAYTKVPGLGRRCPKVGDAAVIALTHYPVEVAAARLTTIQRACRDTFTAETLNTALNAVAEKSNIPRDHLEELTLPTFGLSADGTRRIPLGTRAAELDISTGTPIVTYLNQDGRAIQSLPAHAKRDHADALAALKQEVKDLGKLLTSQRDRLDSLLANPRTWPEADFHRLYLDHPLVSRLARRLIWTVDKTPALYRNDRFEDVAGKPVKVRDTSTISPWHPISATPDTVLAWRQRLEHLQITQPFKQAHREVYVLTDAERQTGTYSHRFAAHLIRQAQFRALATARGWAVGYIGNWDSGGATPTLTLPHHHLRAEFWVDAAPTPDAPTLPGGGSALLSTDQVRFYRTDQSDPLSLDQVPALPFSEVMRDVDLFIAVSSIGNDPTWLPQGDRAGNYWHACSFGDLGASAQTRRDVLSRLLPRLKISPQCTLTDRFLVVQGALGTYKIHLGSSNILMSPNDQYLCIVPDRRKADGHPDVFLPFEGDSTLSMIVSKAFLLAADERITDPLITRQIKAR